MMRNIISALYEFTKEEGKRGIRSSGKGGHELEDRTANKIYDLIRGYGIRVLPPRSPLEYPSLSGIKHQIDNCMIDGKTIYLIECKSGVHKIDHLYSFNSKIVDHALGLEVGALDLSIKGIFLSTSEIGKNSRAFSFTYGIIPVDPFVPPLEYMVSRVPEGDRLREDLLRLEKRVAVSMPAILRSREVRDGKKIAEEFMDRYQDWRRKGYA